MYVHVGNGLSINDSEIIAIFNIDSVKNTEEYQIFYQQLLENKEIKDISNGNAKSLIVTNKNNEMKAYISNIHSNTIQKRKLLKMKEFYRKRD